MVFFLCCQLTWRSKIPFSFCVIRFLVSSLFSSYNAQKHPDVTSGKRLAAQVHREFVEVSVFCDPSYLKYIQIDWNTFALFRYCFQNFTVQDSHGKVSVEAFELYFKFISACYLEENAFQFMMWNVWDLHQVRAGEYTRCHLPMLWSHFMQL